MTRRYEGPKAVTKALAEAIFREGSSEEIAQTLVDVAFSDLDRAWAQERCFDFLRADDWQLWGISAICLCHLLRAGFSIDLETAIPLIDAARRDERARGQANDALGDIRQLHPALVHEREARTRARLAQALRQWLRGAPGLTVGNLWTLLVDEESVLARLLEPIEDRDPSPQERARIDAEARVLLARVDSPAATPIMVFGDEVDAFRALVDGLATGHADALLEIESWLAVLRGVVPIADALLEEANRGGVMAPARLAEVLAALRR